MNMSSVNEEEWRPVVGYEGVYEVSNMGRVKSLAREVERLNKYGLAKLSLRERILKPGKSGRGYFTVYLSKDGIQITHPVHRLVSAAFLNSSVGDHVDHIDRNRLNNSISNLRICGHGSDNHGNMLLSRSNTSGFKGVSFHKQTQKYRAQLQINAKNRNIGYFTNPEDAARAYDEAALAAFGKFAATNAMLGLLPNKDEDND